MIGNAEIDAAVKAMNPRVAATNSVAGSFGNAEAGPMMRDIADNAEIEYDALMALAADVLESACTQPAREHPADYAEGMIYGFITGVLAARAEENRW